MLQTLIIPIAVLILFCFIVILVFLRVFHWNRSTHEATLMFQAVVTSLAILAAGYFYFIERRAAPHLDISQSISILPLEDGYVDIEVLISLKNLGSTLLQLRRVDSRLQRVSPSGLNLNELTSMTIGPKYNKWPEKFLDGTTDMFVKNEMRWPVIRYLTQQASNDIEPGESDTIFVSYIVPCDFKVAKISSQVQKPGYEKWWKAVNFVSVEEACKPKPSIKLGGREK